jgi:TIR domain
VRVFLTWSGPTSKRVAATLREWLPRVIQSTVPYMAEEDLGKGQKWFAEISSQLGQSDFGIVCLTPENLNEPWIHFEAGALGGKLDQARVTPFLVGLSPSDIAGPLTVPSDQVRQGRYRTADQVHEHGWRKWRTGGYGSSWIDLRQVLA